MNLLKSLPVDITQEHFQDLLSGPNIRIERIVSYGQTSPDSGWYDQDEHEWVLVLEGRGEITFEDGRIEKLNKGDTLNIPAHCKHKVSFTDPEQATIWLAIFYK